MKKDVKKKWVKALKSGKFRQTTKTLKDPSGGYCCLGVLCSVTKSKYWLHYTHLPPRLMEKFEISEFDQEELIRMNDEDMIPFKEIATWIDEHL